jgi:hypothetical protein
MSDRLVAATRNCDRPSVGNLKCVFLEVIGESAAADVGSAQSGFAPLLLSAGVAVPEGWEHQATS